jgi:hypothetical protein
VLACAGHIFLEGMDYRSPPAPRRHTLLIFQKTLMAISLAIITLTSPAIGDTLPAGTQPMSREAITKLYSGKTYIYGYRKKSSIYFDPSGEIRITEAGAGAGAGYGIGTWSVAKNREVCYVANFKYLENARVKEHKNYRSCTALAVKADGKIISRAADGKWYLFEGCKTCADEWVSGDIRAKNFLSMRSKFGE